MNYYDRLVVVRIELDKLQLDYLNCECEINKKILLEAIKEKESNYRKLLIDKEDVKNVN